MRRLVVAVSGIVISGIALTGCGEDPTSTSAANPPATNRATDLPTFTSPAAGAPSTSPVPSTSGTATSTTPKAAGTSKVTAVSQTITDKELGREAKITGLVRDFKVPGRFADSEIVLVKATLSGSTKFYSSFGGGDFRLAFDGDNNIPAVPMSTLEDEMKAAGYPLLEDVEASKKGTGWMAFEVRERDAKKLTLLCRRLAMSSANGPIAAKEFRVPLAT